MDELSRLPEALRKLALDRFRSLRPHLEETSRFARSQSRREYHTARLNVISVSASQRWYAKGEMTPALAVRCRTKLKQPLKPASLLSLAHNGTKAYSDAFDLAYRREASGPNAIWKADHSPLDMVFVRPDGKPAKPWLTIVMDDYSRAVAGYLLSFEPPSTLHTSLALRQAIWRKDDVHWNVCGIPDVLYTDHGSDFTSRHLEQVGADLRIRLIFSMQGKPRGRTAAQAR